MKNFFLFSMGYFGLSVVIVFLFRDNGMAPLKYAWDSSVQMIPMFSQIVAGIMLFGLLLAFLTRIQGMRSLVIAVVFAFFGTIVFQGAFTLIKTSLPYIVPFFADPFFADVDRVLHGGIDPWIIAHDIATVLPMDWILPIYLQGWALPAICLPVFIAAVDADLERTRRFVLLYVVGWAVVGNIFAIGGMSAGPVYYDRLLGGERFQGLTDILVSSGLKDGMLGRIQENLWLIYAERGQSIGSGISAFPSVHVSIATVTALYLGERSKWLIPIGILFVASILFLSVYSGYHYAVDGYVSIVFICGLWFALRRNGRQENGSDAVSELTAGGRVG